jgi:hypothetical protein
MPVHLARARRPGIAPDALSEALLSASQVEINPRREKDAPQSPKGKFPGLGKL